MSLVLYAAGSSANHTYVPRATGVDRVDLVENTVGTLANPLTIVETLSLKGPAAQGNQRWSASIRRNITDAATSVPFTGSLTLQLSLPKSTDWTEAFTKDLCSEGASLLGAAKAYGTGGAVVSGCTDTSAFPNSIAKLLFVGV